MKLTTLALRNLGRQKRRTFLLAGAIAFGILVVTVVNGAAGGLALNLQRNFSQLLGGEIFLQGVEKTPGGQRIEIINDDAALTAAVNASGIRARSLTRSSRFLGTFLFHGVTAIQEVVGTDLGAASPVRGRLTLLSGSFDGMSNPQGIIIGQKVADRLKAQVGDTVLVRLRTVTGQANVAEFTLVGTAYDPGMSASFAAYANRAYVNTLQGLPADAYQQLGILLDDQSETNAAAAQLSTALSRTVTLLPPLPKSARGGFVGAMMQEHNENPMGAMIQEVMAQAGDTEYQGTRYRVTTINDILGRLQLPMIIGAVSGVAFAVLAILCLIIVVGVINTFRIVLNERTREIGTMRALGMQKRRVRRLFLTEAFLLFAGGALAGLAAAALLMFLLGLPRFTPQTPAFLMLSGGQASFVISAGLVLASVALVGVVTVLGATLPARRAAKLTPVLALRAVH